MVEHGPVDQTAHGKEGFDGVTQIMVSGVAGSVAREISIVKALHDFENITDRPGVEVCRYPLQNLKHLAQDVFGRTDRKQLVQVF